MSDQTVLIVVAHPDDEVLGCGGTLAKHAKNGDSVHVAILAEGITSRDDMRDRAKRQVAIEELRDCANKANAIIGARSVEFYDFPDNRMDTITLLDVVKQIENLIEKYTPKYIYTHWVGDVNIDHRVIHNAVNVACRPQPGNSVERLLYFETASSTECQPPGSQPDFLPNWFCNIEDTLSPKLSALKTYHGEMRDWPHSRSIQSIEHQAAWRGSSVGVKAAEAFMVGRILA